MNPSDREHYDKNTVRDGAGPTMTVTSKLPERLRLKPCIICGKLEVYAVMGPAVPMAEAIPTACEDHLEQVRAFARGEKVEIQWAN